jgi:hypothetical protein
MNPRAFNIALLLTLCLLPTAAYGQPEKTDPYVRKGSIGISPKPPPPPPSPFTPRPIDTWLGERFIFLPKLKSFQSFGYQSMHNEESVFSTLKYADYAGKTARVVKVAPHKTIKDFWNVQLKLEETGEIVFASAPGGTIEGLAPIADIDFARSQFLGKILWTTEMVSTYNEETDEVGYVSISGRTPFPVKVIDIVAGWQSSQPVRFIVKVSKGLETVEGFIDVYISGTNVPDLLREYHSFQSTFLTKSPTTQTDPHLP